MGDGWHVGNGQHDGRRHDNHGKGQQAGGTTTAADGADPHHPPPLFESQDAEDAAYREYNAKYCLNYVRTFFNHHLDDPWFRSRLSPLEAHRQAARERKRASAEACEIRREVAQSLEDAAKGAIPKKDPGSPEYLGPPRCNFVAGVPARGRDEAHRHRGRPALPTATTSGCGSTA